jgi:hypothetical protein
MQSARGVRERLHADLPTRLSMARDACAHHVTSKKSIQGSSESWCKISTATKSGPRGFFCEPPRKVSFHNAAGHASGHSMVVATKSSIYTSDTRVRSLQTLWDLKRLPGGELETRNDKSLGQKGEVKEEPLVYCPEDKKLNDAVSHLHSLARSGTYYDSIQSHIDGYLGAVAFVRENPSKADIARRIVCNYMQSPQEGNLPDLCGMIRGMLDGNGERFSGSHAFLSMFQALPCVRKPLKKITANIDRDFHLSINVLLGLMLGLYPSSLKFPPFSVRVNIFRRVHCLLTNGTGVEFCKSNPHLITLAYMEYCAYVIPCYMPAEHEVLCKEQGMQSFFQTCSLICDSFRQDSVLTGEENWKSLDDICVALVERHARTCKNRSKTKSSTAGLCLKISADHSNFYMSLPFVYPYAVHHEDSSNCIMAGEMKFLVDPDESTRGNNFRDESALDMPNLEHAVAIQRIVNAQYLPKNLFHVQMKSFARKTAVCERSALSGSKLYLCIPCILRGPNTLKPGVMRGMCKLDVQSGTYMCSYCSNPEIVHMNTLGKVVCIRNHRFYYAPCCNSVQLYTGRGDEFYETIQKDTLLLRVTCSHQKPKVQQRQGRHRCAVCNNVSTQEPHTSVDHLSGEMHTVYLCGRHTPNQFALRQSVNWEQLTDEILRRDKPLFAISSSNKKKY